MIWSFAVIQLTTVRRRCASSRKNARRLQEDMTCLNTLSTRLASFHIAVLFDATVIDFNGPSVLCPHRALCLGHCDVARGPMLYLTVRLGFRPFLALMIALN